MYTFEPVWAREHAKSIQIWTNNLKKANITMASIRDERIYTSDHSCTCNRTLV